MEGFTFVEKSVYVCERFTLVGGFTFDCVTGCNSQGILRHECYVMYCSILASSQQFNYVLLLFLSIRITQ